MMTVYGHTIPEVKRANSVREAEQQMLYFRTARDYLTARMQEVIPFSEEYDRIFMDLCEVSGRFRQAVTEVTKTKLCEPITTFQ